MLRIVPMNAFLSLLLRACCRFSRVVVIASALLPAVAATAQDDDVRSGWTFGLLPSASYDADLGLRMGVLANIYYFGDGSLYPEYLHSLYLEASTTSKHSGLYNINYDSRHLIPGHRVSVDLSYLPDAMCDFYGFGGYQSVIDPAMRTESMRTYYMMRRDLIRMELDLQGPLGRRFLWDLGGGLLSFRNGPVDVDRLNRYASDEAATLPHITTLYDRYCALGLVDAGIASGGAHPFLHGGVSYDSRDRQQNPRRGISADVFLTAYGALGRARDYANLKLNLAFRHFVPVVKDRVTLAYQLGAQITLAGRSPFYLDSYIDHLYYEQAQYEGLGGGSSVRGILRYRVVGRSVAYSNIELRTRLVDFRIRKEHFYVGLNPFLDGGMLLHPYDLKGPADDPSASPYAPHFGAGCGLKVVMDENFVVALDAATPLDARDNDSPLNLYLGIGYLF